MKPLLGFPCLWKLARAKQSRGDGICLKLGGGGHIEYNIQQTA